MQFRSPSLAVSLLGGGIRRLPPTILYVITNYLKKKKEKKKTFGIMFLIILFTYWISIIF